MRMEWLGPDFQSEREEGLFARLDPQGDVIGFGYAGPHTRLYVDVASRQVTDAKLIAYDDEVEFDDWLADWREQARDAARPYTERLKCSFCGKSNAEVRKLIAGPSSYICNECVELCAEILSEDVPLG